MNRVQMKSIALMKNDLKFIYTIFINSNIVKYSYYVAFMPYMGVIIDGVEDWVKSYNNSNKDKLDISTFNKEEQKYYETMRNSIKMFENGIEETYKLLQEKYKQSEDYFSSVCKPIAKKLHLYDIFGVYKVNGEYCDNTILDSYYVPAYNYRNNNGEFIKHMAKISGKYVVCFNAMDSYLINTNYRFSTDDYGGFIKSPVGNKFSYKFLLFSIYCQINFVIKCYR